MPHLLDTNHCIFIKNALYKRVENRKIFEQKALDGFEKTSDIETVYISMVSIGELYYGAENSEHQEINYKKLESFLEMVSIVEISQETWILHGKTRAFLRRQGRKIADMDLLIACTAKINDYILLSADNDFNNLPVDFVKVEDWTQ